MRRRLAELEQTLSAIQNGEVDAFLVTGDRGDQVYTLKSAERPYRIMVEQMSEGALTLSADGVILYCNESFARIVRCPREEVMATSIFYYVGTASQKKLRKLVEHGGHGDIFLLARNNILVPVHISLNAMHEDDLVYYCMVVTDLTEHVQTEQIIASEKFARILLEQSADAILICDTGGNIIRASEKALSLLGGDLLEQTLDQVFNQLYPDPGTGKIARTGGDPVKFYQIRDAIIPQSSEIVAGTEDSLCRNLLLNYSQISEGNSVLGYSISLSDITERKRAEDELKRYAAELETAYQELEAFSYSVSHDLRAPLRTLEGFSQIVAEDYGNKLDATGKDYLNRVRKASHYMSELIDDMLKLSRVTRTDMYQDKSNLSQITQSIIEELKAAHPERRVEYVISPDMIVYGDNQLLSIAMRNLLENAWKFTGKSPQTCIEVGVIRNDGENIYFVKDNGTGFDMRYVDKLFQPFQRLHSNTEYEGTGIGLAIVQRIIRRHGGKIWAESAKGQGATFYFSLSQ